MSHVANVVKSGRYRHSAPISALQALTVMRQFCKLDNSGQYRGLAPFYETTRVRDYAWRSGSLF
jgi:hypothetical protein